MMKYKILLFIGFQVAALCLFFYQPTIQPLQSEFEAWAALHNKQYQSSSQYHYRMAIYAQNKQLVHKHNAQADEGLHTYYLSLNMFADQTQFQYKQKNILSIKKQSITKTHGCNGTIADTPKPPAQVDWSVKYLVPNVYAQKASCPTNWAFAATAAIQGLVALKLSVLTKLSDQQLVDCSEEYGNEGCGGGFMEQAFWYVIDHGIATNQTYPYTGSSGKCTYSPTQKYAKIGRCARVPEKNYSKLLSATVQQPVAVAVNSAPFYLYSHGIFTSACGTQLDRGMLIVGYGMENNQSYWKVKNSLGEGWGENGYIRLERQEEDGVGKCGIQLAASVPQQVSS